MFHRLTFRLIIRDISQCSKSEGPNTKIPLRIKILIREEKEEFLYYEERERIKVRLSLPKTTSFLT